ncbi:DUF4838 domain-containing protein [Streptococcus marmotae]|uniref:DUF4838 domain-containing protein n=1 Tax=Streptococcus marmotae TaxID=1825069 RepID=UPI00082B02ED|nr:DUF4838 domain-containing protein [Streptococcus marmotae]
MDITIYTDNKTVTSNFAISELTTYLFKLFAKKVVEIDNVQADLVLSVIPDNKETDCISIRLANGQGTIVGNSDIALLIGVYRLLNEFGVVFTRPGRQNEVVPTLDGAVWEAKVISVDEVASYKHRGVCIEGADSYENVSDFIDWLPKIRMNSFFIQFENPYSFLKRWYEHEFNPYQEKEPFNQEIAQKMSDRLDKELAKRGLRHHRVGHGWTGEVLGYSSKYGWESGLTLPKEKEHLVAQLDGKRELYNTAPILTSLCFSNSEVSQKMVELIVSYAKERPDVDYLHVWLSDARNNICECEDCQKDIPADQYIRILNELDVALEAENLETKICFLLYHELLFAPKYEILKNPNRFTMMFAPITRTFEKSYADVNYEGGIPQAKSYIRNKMVLPNSLEENLSYLFSWKKMFQGDSFVYDYPLGRAHYGDFGYMKISKTIYRDVQFLEQLQLNGYISCQELRAGFPHNFPNYVMGQMLWNKEQVYEDLKTHYFSALYGKNWPEAVSYLETLSRYSSCDHFNAIGERQNAILGVEYAVSRNLADNMLPVIEKNIVENCGIQRHEWRQLAYHREYIVKMSTALALLASGNLQEAQRKWRDVLDYIRNHEMHFQQNLDVYRVIEVAKNYAGFTL